MEVIGVLIVLALLGAMALAPVLALVAMSRTSRLQREVDQLRAEVNRLRAGTPRPAAHEPAPPGTVRPAEARPLEAGPPAETVRPPETARPPEGTRPSTPVEPEPVPPPMPSTTLPEPTVATSTPAARPPASEPPRREPPRREPPPRRPAPPPAADFATNLGPRLLVAAGALAVVVFLGLFVKYAWENDWVGPAGRVLTGAVTGLALVAGGVRLLGREYRPLGQGLAGAGLAGLYVSAFAAHGFYGLVPREASGLFMVAITGCAVLLAARLDTRLLALLAWVGGYLTPVLLSTGEDKAIALFLYLALLDAGALVLDHRRPWAETLPVAMAGTLILYAGWFERFYTPDRFEVAAFGLVLFTAMFAIGAARKERHAFGAVMVPLVGIGLAGLAQADRPAELLVLSLALTAVAVQAGRRLGIHFGLLGLFAGALPLMAWAATHYRPEALVWAAAWLLGGMLVVCAPALFARDDAAPAGSGGLAAVALALGGLGSMILASETDRPVGLLVYLTAYALLAVLVAVRQPVGELVGSVAVALSILAWAASFDVGDRTRDLIVLALPPWAVFLLGRVVRSALGATLGASGMLAQIVAATFAWMSLWVALWPDHASALGIVSVALAAAYLALGLAALRRAEAPDARHVRVMLSLAATFLTLAIPVQLGLHGITVGWALEGAVLVGLGLRFGSGLMRLGGLFVLAMAVLRLFGWHLPLHRAEFAPVFNAAFGTWLAVILVLAGAAELMRRRRDVLQPGEGGVRVALSALAILLLFGLLTGEAGSWFAVQAREAFAAGDGMAARSAELKGRLAVSVLWTAFATGLLASGLGLRSRPLFYAAYALFAVTAAKVTVVDLASQHPLYRMLSFLALGLLLLAGAWLNIRFRERLAEPVSHPTAA